MKKIEKKGTWGQKSWTKLLGVWKRLSSPGGKTKKETPRRG